MELSVSERKADKKSTCKALRREGKIPAVIYSRGNAGKTLAVNRNEFQKVLKERPGTLSTVVFSLKEGNKKAVRGIVKDIQYHVTTYEVLHIDFAELIEDVAIDINVPILCTGVMDCVGIKLGGTLRQVMRSLRVRCLPKDIPSQFEIDVHELNVGQGKRLSELAMPSGVRSLVDLKSMAVVISKK